MPKKQEDTQISYLHEFAITDRNEAVKEMKRELAKNIGEAQSIILMQKTPPQEIRKRLMNPSKPPGRGNPEFSYIEHAYVTETLNWATMLNWDVVVEVRERLDNEAIVHGYIEVRFPNNFTIKKYGSGGMKYIANNPNMGWADAFKGATSDMIKNCAARLGIGLDLYRTEEQYIAEVKKQAPAPKPQPTNNDPANSKQLDALRALGVDFPDNLTFTQASELLRKEAELAKKGK